eukprot:scaffold51602_cov41-Prasinocladus_malaysianus.AAC.2
MEQERLTKDDKRLTTQWRTVSIQMASHHRDSARGSGMQERSRCAKSPSAVGARQSLRCQRLRNWSQIPQQNDV